MTDTNVFARFEPMLREAMEQSAILQSRCINQAFAIGEMTVEIGRLNAVIAGLTEELGRPREPASPPDPLGR